MAVAPILAGPPAAAQERPRPGSIRIVRDGSLGFGLRASDAPLEAIGQVMGRAMGCRVEVDKELRDQRLTLRLGARPPEQLLRGVARRIYARLEIAYRLEPMPPGELRRPGSLALANQLVNFPTTRETTLEEALRELSLPVRVEEGISGSVRVSAAYLPLARVLDRFAAQLNARWVTVITLGARKPVDPAAAVDERMHAHFSDLAHLASRERQEEIQADVKRIERLPEKERAAALDQMALDVLSLAGIYERVPGEHRAPVAPLIAGIAQDYGAVLSRLPHDRRAAFQPIFGSLETLRQRLAQIR